MESHPQTKLYLGRSKALIGLIILNTILGVAAIFLFWQNFRNYSVSVDGLRPMVALVNGQPIYTRDLFSANSGNPTHLREALGGMVENEVIAQRAATQFVDAQEVEALWTLLTRQFADEADLAASLAKAGLSREQVRHRLLIHLQVEHWLRQFSAAIPSDADLAAWQVAHPEAFALPEVVEAFHLAAIVSPENAAADLPTKAGLIRSVQARLQEGIPFPQLVEAFSEDPAKKNTRGSLGWFTRERMDPDLAKAAFALPIGTISPPVQTRFGYHLLLVSDHHAASTVTPESAAAEALARLRDEFGRKKMRAKIDDLVQRAKVEILDPNLRSPTL